MITLNDNNANDILNLIYTKYANYKDNIIITGSFGLYLQGINLNREIKDINILFSDYDNIINNIDLGEAYEYLINNGYDVIFKILKDNNCEANSNYINNITFNDKNLKVISPEYILFCKRTSLKVINKEIKKNRNDVKAINKRIPVERTEEMDNFVYELFKCVIDNIPNKDIVFCGSLVAYLHNIKLNRVYYKDVDCFINEKITYQENLQLKKLYKNIIKENTIYNNVFVDILYWKTPGIVNALGKYDIVHLKDRDFKIVTFEDFINTYTVKSFLIDNQQKINSDINILEKFLYGNQEESDQEEIILN